MRNGFRQSAARGRLNKIGMLLLALICLITVVRSQSVEHDSYYGLDSETITGLNSTTEVFKRAGTYSLHESTPRTPICTHCQPTQVQTDSGVHVELKTPDFFNRYLLASPVFIAVDQSTRSVIQTESLILVGEFIAPDSPPPRSR